MIFAGFLFLLLLTGGSSWNNTEQPELQDDLKSNHSVEERGKTFNNSELKELSSQLSKNDKDNDYKVAEDDVCNYHKVIEFLKLKNNGTFSMVRPIKNPQKPTWVSIQLSILAILDVRETDQTFVSYIGIYVTWYNPYIYWNPRNFCDIHRMRVPADLLWKPDLTIEEMIEKDKATIPFITINSNHLVEYVKDIMVVSMCKMQVYKFPFDVQSCTLSFKSITYPEEELKFQATENKSLITEWSREMLRNQFEWLFIDIASKIKTEKYFQENQSMVIYTVTMKRHSALYIVNFLVPILFFFFLDLASFLISDYGGEKLSFKVTVLLAVTVMQLILNEILPSSSNRIPLIAVYCIGMFGLMMISLLETILVMYLIEKDSEPKENKADKNGSLSEECGDKQGNYDGDVKKWTHCACVCNVFEEPPSELLSVAKEDKRSHLTEESNSLEKLPDELSEAVKTLSLLLSRKEERKPDSWTRVAKKLDIIFFYVYITVATLFLVVIFSVWINAKDE
ncbi:5-hydroxytryptamine receptor 3A-like isoform X2 [Eleginops maclovinus]|uniref:5-hydroxytryptamine receptor 3A-like isoform X2 n=1 Tax=Eleginops maclovinus TaxID=56733 RepID=UPI00307FFD45